MFILSNINKNLEMNNLGNRCFVRTFVSIECVPIHIAELSVEICIKEKTI